MYTRPHLPLYSGGKGALHTEILHQVVLHNMSHVNQLCDRFGYKFSNFVENGAMLVFPREV